MRPGNKKKRKENSQCSSTVYGIIGAENITDLFYDEFNCLYNSVPYSECEMDNLKNYTDTRLDHDKLCYLKDQIYVMYIWLWKTWKRGGIVNVISECIIPAPHRLQVPLAMLFNIMVIHGTAAEGSLEVSMTPILNTLRPRQNGSYFPDDIFKCILLNENG